MNEVLEKIFETITNIENQIIVENFSNDLSYYNKAIKTLDTLKNRLKNQDSLLFDNKNTTTSIQNNLNSLLSYIKSYQDTKNRTYLDNINTSLNTIITLANSIPVNLKGETATNLKKILQNFETNNLSIIEEIRKYKDDLERRVKELTNQISLLEKRIDTKNTELDSISSNQQNQFSVAQEKRLNDFTDKIKEFENTFKEKEKEQSSIYSTTFDELKSNAENKLLLMEEIKEKIENIYSIVGQESIVGSQKMYADKAKDFANILFWFSIILMVAFACTVIWPVLRVVCTDVVVFDNTKTLADVNWGILLYRLPVSALLLLPAIYMANESKKQRDKENKYRELEIKMAAIEPYFNNICEKCKDNNTQLPEKDAVKLELAKALLSPNQNQTDENTIIPQDVSNLIENIVKLVYKR